MCLLWSCSGWSWIGTRNARLTLDFRSALDLLLDVPVYHSLFGHARSHRTPSPFLDVHRTHSTMGKVHGSLARAGKVKSQTPKVEKQEKKKQPKGRAKKRAQFIRR